MSKQSGNPPRIRAARYACALAVIALLGTAAVGTVDAVAADLTDGKPRAGTPMDSAKMDAMKSMPATKSTESAKGIGGMKQMDGMSMTGDADYDFAANMRTHHQMAVDMAEAQIKNGRDAKMIKMAKEIMAAQKKEITIFDKWMAAHQKAGAGGMRKMQ